MARTGFLPIAAAVALTAAAALSIAAEHAGTHAAMHHDEINAAAPRAIGVGSRALTGNEVGGPAVNGRP
jgi:hypothetical protein